MKNKYEIIGQNTEGEGMLPMKQSPDLEAKKSIQQKNNELCNFLKNAFVVDGKVKMVAGKIKIKTPVYFLLEDSKRGIIKLAFEPYKENEK